MSLGLNKILKFLEKYWPHGLTFLFIIFYYKDSLTLPILDDEISAYSLPTLRLLEQNWDKLLPWNFQPEFFFGHPPLNYIYYGLALSLFPKTLVTIRIASLLISLVGVFTLFKIGKELRSYSLGLVLMFLGLSHFVFWENADLMYADNLFNTFYLLFFLSYIKSAKWPLFLAGCCMILTRETAFFPLLAFMFVNLLNSYVQKKSNNLRTLIVLFIIQLSWFLFLYLHSGTSTPVYNADGFNFYWRFVFNTMGFIFKENHVQSYWWLPITFIMFNLILGWKKLKHLVFDFWMLPLTTILMFVGLTTITSSISRYQTVGISSLIIFFGLICWEVSDKFVQVMKYSVIGLMLTLFGRNLYISSMHRERNLEFQKSCYACAKKIIESKFPGKWIIAGWPIRDLVTHMDQLEKLQWSTAPQSIHFLDYQANMDLDIDFDYFAAFELSQSKKDYQFFQQLKQRRELELVPGLLQNSECLIYRKVK